VQLTRDEIPNVASSAVYIAKQDRSKVALMCGGGSGHEPAHVGFVGQRPQIHSACEFSLIQN
jgi:dihydroxyacetone kinase